MGGMVFVRVALYYHVIRFGKNGKAHKKGYLLAWVISEHRSCSSCIPCAITM